MPIYIYLYMLMAAIVQLNLCGAHRGLFLGDLLVLVSPNSNMLTYMDDLKFTQK